MRLSSNMMTHHNYLDVPVMIVTCLVLYRTIKSKERDSELKHDLLSYCRQIALGLNYLVSKQFIHRDLAARNILVSSDDVCKVCCVMVYYIYA